MYRESRENIKVGNLQFCLELIPCLHLTLPQGSIWKLKQHSFVFRSGEEMGPKYSRLDFLGLLKPLVPRQKSYAKKEKREL